MTDPTTWADIYKCSAHIPDRDDELIPVTRETLRLATHALRKMNEDDYYHNNGWAEREILAALENPARDDSAKRSAKPDGKVPNGTMSPIDAALKNAAKAINREADRKEANLRASQIRESEK